MHIAKDQIQRILIIQPSRLGDCIFCLPAVATLRKSFPNAYIAWLVDDRCQDIVTDNPDINEVIILHRNRLQPKQIASTCRYISELKHTLRSKQFDLSIDFNGLLKSGILAYLSGAKYRIGSFNTLGMRELSYLFSHEVPVLDSEQHVIDRHLAIIRYLGGTRDGTHFPIQISDQDKQVVQNLLKSQNISTTVPLVVIHPGAGWITRRWFKDRFAQLADILIDKYQVNIAFVGGRVGGMNETGLVDDIIRMMRNPAINLMDQISIKQLVALFYQTQLFIGNIAGPMHIATAVNVPVIALVGPTNPATDGPYGDNAMVIRKELSCSYCRKKHCKTLTCMDKISVDEVAAAAGSILSRNRT
ncbi:MAG: glycosyltransferase family 9 protein [bacterium]